MRTRRVQSKIGKLLFHRMGIVGVLIIAQIVLYGVGLAVLYALSGVGGLAGVHLGVNLVNALVLGLLGAPGFGLLLMVHWVLGL